MPVVLSPTNVMPGRLAEPEKNVSGVVMGVVPLEAIDPVSAVAMSERSALTAADEITVPGMNGASGSVYTPVLLRGNCTTPIVLHG